MFSNADNNQNQNLESDFTNNNQIGEIRTTETSKNIEASEKVSERRENLNSQPKENSLFSKDTITPDSSQTKNETITGNPNVTNQETVTSQLIDINPNKNASAANESALENVIKESAKIASLEKSNVSSTTIGRNESQTSFSPINSNVSNIKTNNQTDSINIYKNHTDESSPIKNSSLNTSSSTTNELISNLTQTMKEALLQRQSINEENTFEENSSKLSKEKTFHKELEKMIFQLEEKLAKRQALLQPIENVTRLLSNARISPIKSPLNTSTSEKYSRPESETSSFMNKNHLLESDRSSTPTSKLTETTVARDILNSINDDIKMLHKATEIITPKNASMFKPSEMSNSDDVIVMNGNKVFKIKDTETAGKRRLNNITEHGLKEFNSTNKLMKDKMFLEAPNGLDPFASRRVPLLMTVLL